MIQRTVLLAPISALLLTSSACGSANDQVDDSSALEVEFQTQRATLIVDAPPGLSNEGKRAIEDESTVDQRRLKFGQPYETTSGRSCVTLTNELDIVGGAPPRYTSSRCFDIPNGQTLHVRPTTLKLSVNTEKLEDDFARPVQLRIDGAITIVGSFNAPLYNPRGPVGEAGYYAPPPPPNAPQTFVTFGGDMKIKMGFGIESDMTDVIHEATYTISDASPLTVAFDPPELRAFIRIEAPARKLPNASVASSALVTLEPQRGVAAVDESFTKTRTLRFFPKRAGVAAAERFTVAVNGTKFEAPAPARGETASVPLRRLDVHHLKDADGVKHPGTYRVDWLDPNDPTRQWTVIPSYQQRELPTGTGLDLVAGKYHLAVVAGQLGASQDIDL